MANVVRQCGGINYDLLGDPNCGMDVKKSREEARVHFEPRHFHHRLCAIVVLNDPWQAVYVLVCLAFPFVRYRWIIYYHDVDDF